mmetsp:Transcript_6288/g.15299  ORF Transcript_6288/g.15299 Transcript_6288/m.15299 type:complete len:115 (+) Transcript_6288:854-1198(+)
MWLSIVASKVLVRIFFLSLLQYCLQYIHQKPAGASDSCSMQFRHCHDEWYSLIWWGPVGCHKLPLNCFSQCLRIVFAANNYRMTGIRRTIFHEELFKQSLEVDKIITMDNPTPK